MSRKITIIAIGAIGGGSLVAVLIGLVAWMSHPKTGTAAQTAAAVTEPPVDPLPRSVEDIIARYRKTIVLLDDDASLPEPDRARDSIVGKIIFQENHQAISVLSEQLTAEIEQAGDFSRPLPLVGQFLDAIETQQDLHDGDKLAVREIFADIAESLSGIQNSAQAKVELESRVDTDRKALAEIQSLYEKELDKIFGRFETRGMIVRREAWERYVAYLHTKYKREDILKPYAAAIRMISSIGKPGGGRENDLEIYGSKLPDKTFVLSFDDGPHPRYTDQILDILKKNDVKSVFFELGTNLGTLKLNKVHQTKAAAAARHVAEAGHAIGSHGFSHTLLPTMSDREVANEIDETNRMLENVVHVHPAIFRPPYGGTDVKVLAAMEARTMKSVLWNIDSNDWADPVAKSIANRVIGDAHRLGHGIILLHDIHGQTVEALPLIIDTLKNQGYRFLSWNGNAFAEDAPKITQAAVPDPPLQLYRESWAVIIGIDNYPKWPKLSYAVNDANGMKEILVRKYGFKPEHVLTLLNEDATRQKILSALGDTLSNPQNVARDDRVFVFFAGHGATRKLSSGRDLGYIIPYDADPQSLEGQSISMTNFQDISEGIPAKHVLFVMDSCYSGLALTRSGATDKYIREVARRPARQILTAGGANEEVADTGPNGHSVFTWTVLQGLEGRADLNSDGYISGSELASFVGPSVSALGTQTPAFGNLPGNEGGEFLFELHPEKEFLSQQSTQLDQEAIQINAELDQMRKDVAVKSERNAQLKNQLAAARAEQAKTIAATPALKPANTAAAHENKGLNFFRERKYPEALNEFLTATKLDPTFVQAANDLGFTYYKMDKLDDAVKWLEKAIKLDPSRPVAYANLGDAYYNLKRSADAKRVYEKYLELEPNAKYAAIVRSRLAE